MRTVWRWEHGKCVPRGRHALLLDKVFREQPPVPPKCSRCVELSLALVDVTTNLVRLRARMAEGQKVEAPGGDDLADLEQAS